MTVAPVEPVDPTPESSMIWDGISYIGNVESQRELQEAVNQSVIDGFDNISTSVKEFITFSNTQVGKLDEWINAISNSHLGEASDSIQDLAETDSEETLLKIKDFHVTSVKKIDNLGAQVFNGVRSVVNFVCQLALSPAALLGLKPVAQLIQNMVATTTASVARLAFFMVANVVTHSMPYVTALGLIAGIGATCYFAAPVVTAAMSIGIAYLTHKCNGLQNDLNELQQQFI